MENHPQGGSCEIHLRVVHLNALELNHCIREEDNPKLLGVVLCVC